AVPAAAAAAPAAAACARDVDRHPRAHDWEAPGSAAAAAALARRAGFASLSGRAFITARRDLPVGETAFSGRSRGPLRTCRPVRASSDGVPALAPCPGGGQAGGAVLPGVTVRDELAIAPRARHAHLPVRTSSDGHDGHAARVRGPGAASVNPGFSCRAIE